MRRHNFKTIGTRVVLALIIGLLAGGQASALSQNQLDVFGSGIYYFDPDTGGCEVTDGTAAQKTLVGNDNIEKAFNFFVGQGLTAAATSGLIGNLMQESGVNPQSVQDPAKGDGHGIAQWGGSRFANLQKEGSQQSPPVPWTDLMLQLNFLWEELPGEHANSHLDELKQVEPNATAQTSALDALKMATSVTVAAQAFEYTYERAGDPAMENRVNNAAAVYAKYGNGAGGSDAIQATCTTASGNGVVLGNITASAVGLAWPTNQGHDVPNGAPDNVITASATSAYQAAWDGASDMTDCGAFVATVMIKSGADPNYPKSGTSIQYQYVQSSSKYTTFKPTSSASLKPGDILIETNGIGHTMIYVGPQTGGYVVVDASWHTHTPMLNTAGDLQWMLQQSSVIAARYTGNADTSVL